jgi:Uma2 family endonuclease
MLVQETAAPERLITADEFEHIVDLPENRERLLELINGEIVEKMPTQEHGFIAGNIITAINIFAKPRRLGRAAVEARHRAPEDSINARMPDVSFTSARQPMVTRGSVMYMPDLAVEIQSPDDTVKMMREKAIYYLANGARLVWLVYPRKHFIEVYSSDADVEILLEGDALTGGDVLPGFALPVAEVFADPLAE